MKSRGVTYLLLVITAVIWGVVAWKLFSAASAPAVPAPRAAARAVAPETPDTLRLDYPDPFLKAKTKPVRESVQALAPAPVQVRREKVRIVHLATIASAGGCYYVLTIGNEQYEAARGGMAGEFVVSGCDADSLYLRKEGALYGVKLCE